VDFLLGLKPLYLPTVLVIKQAELARCVYSHLGFNQITDVPVFNEVFSQARVASGLSNVLLGYGLKDFMLYFVKNPSELDQYRNVEQHTLSAQHTIRRARDLGKTKDTNIQRRIWREWFGSMMPLRGPDKRLIAQKDTQKLLDAFVEHPDLVLSTCPAICAESRLSDVRANAGNRNPQLQDAIDLMHSVPALAYCDALVSNDGHVVRCAKEVVKVTCRPMVLCRSLHEAVSLLFP
jgi:hypothetical protein